MRPIWAICTQSGQKCSRIVKKKFNHVSGQLQMEHLRGAGICGLRRAAPARQSCFAAAPAKMSLTKGKSATSGVGCCNAMNGLTIMSCPAQTEKKARDCLKITRRHFSSGQQEVGIRLYRHRASRNSLRKGFSWPIRRCSTPEFLWLQQ